MSDDSADATDVVAAPLPTGWARLGPHKWSMGLAQKIGPSIAIGGYLAAFVTAQFLRGVDWPLAIAVAVLVLGAFVAAVALFIHLRFPQPWVNFDTGEIRTGRYTASFVDIDFARLFAAPKRGSRILTFQVGVTKGPQVIVRLRDAKDQLLAPETARLLTEVLRRSSVRMPQSNDDPTGRFARYNFPGYLTLEDAIAVVESPPGPKDPLPVESVI
ncbi:hypothetical protein [Mycetocola sp. 2940]|uniref:hypothetical protein n=1 Tax=Mycetocola sp. 2940 TaxID=3156452 RepID=UPI0033956F69